MKDKKGSKSLEPFSSGDITAWDMASSKEWGPCGVAASGRSGQKEDYLDYCQDQASLLRVPGGESGHGPQKVEMRCLFVPIVEIT